jgi:hypothetical protein
MSFTFTNYAGIKPQQSPLHDLIGNLLSGYTDTTKAQFLRPNLQEALTKSKLENKYYGPNIESQIGLRGAQAGHLGAMTQGLNISNPFLKHKLEQEEAQRQFGIDNPLLAKSGAAGQIGALMLLQQHPELMQAMQQGQMQGSPQQNPMPNQQMQDQGQSYMPSLMQQQPQQQGMGAPNPMELLQQSILKSLQPKAGKQTQLELAQDYANQQSQIHGKDSEEAQLAKDYVDKVAHGTKKQKDLALQEHRERADNMALWKSLPAPAKAHAIAIGQGAGFSGDETARWLASGKSMKDLLFQHGIKDESEIDPVYQLTGANQTQLLQRQFAAKEADYLGEFIRKNTGDYARTVAGYSPNLIKDQLQGKNEEKQAKLLASRGLAQELVNLRLVLAGAKSTVHAQQALSKNAMLDLKNLRSFVSPKVWKRTQEVMDSELQNMFKQAHKGFGRKVSNAIKADKAKESGNDPLGIR